MAAQKQHLPEHEEIHQDMHETEMSARPTLPASEHGSAPSPARALQAGLEAEFSRRDFPFTQMQVLSAIVVFCFAFWWALFQITALII